MFLFPRRSAAFCEPRSGSIPAFASPGRNRANPHRRRGCRSGSKIFNRSQASPRAKAASPSSSIPQFETSRWCRVGRNETRERFDHSSGEGVYPGVMGRRWKLRSRSSNGKPIRGAMNSGRKMVSKRTIRLAKLDSTRLRTASDAVDRNSVAFVQSGQPRICLAGFAPSQCGSSNLRMRFKCGPASPFQTARGPVN